MSKIGVVGCGIIGLTSALRLQEAGHEVQIFARELPPWTTSNKAAAVWEPYAAEPKDKVREWAARSYAVYQQESTDERSGVEPIELIAVARKELPDPFWLRPEYPFRRLTSPELPLGFTEGFAVKVPFIHSGIYLDHLVRRFAAAGGDIELRTLRSLAEIADRVDLLVNCSGLGARELVGDGDVFPIRGQLAIVAPTKPVRFLVDDHSHADPVYVFPRDGVAILGGSAEHGAENMDEDIATRARILERTQALEPSLAEACFLKAVVGLRPGRTEIRLETEALDNGTPVVHNYGHGGAGFTTAWGCADEVAQRAEEALKQLSS